MFQKPRRFQRKPRSWVLGLRIGSVALSLWLIFVTIRAYALQIPDASTVFWSSAMFIAAVAAVNKYVD